MPPLGLPATNIVRTPDNFEAPIKAFVDGLETATSAATAAAAAATTAVAQKYTKPAGGIPVSDLAGSAVNIVVLRPVAGAWPVRPTSSTNVTYIWLRAALTDPVVPIGGTGAVVGIDLVLQPDA